MHKNRRPFWQFRAKRGAGLLYSEDGMKLLRRSIRELEEGKAVTKTMDELEEMANG